MLDAADGFLPILLAAAEVEDAGNLEDLRGEEGENLWGCEEDLLWTFISSTLRETGTGQLLVLILVAVLVGFWHLMAPVVAGLGPRRLFKALSLSP